MAIQHHTARFRFAPQLTKVLSLPTPAVRKPGLLWTALPRPASVGIELTVLAEELKASDVGLEFLTGELKGSHDPSGIVFDEQAATAVST